MVFSISIGDLFTTLALIHDIQCALKDTHGAASQYCAVTSRLESLESTLAHLVAIGCDNEALSQTLKQTTSRFGASIDVFLQKIRKYEPALKHGGCKNKWEVAWRKVQWKFCSKEDIHDFQAEILTHAFSIQLLLQSAHM